MTKRVPTVFMGSDAIALPLLEEIHGFFGAELDLSGIFTQPDRRSGRGMKRHPNAIKQWADAHGVPLLQPVEFAAAESDWLRQSGCNLIIGMAYGQILKQSVLDIPALGAINFHASLLPAYRGASPIQAAVENGEITTGVSMMRMIRKLDAGPVIDVESVAVRREDFASTVSGNIAEACRPLVRRALPGVLAGGAPGQPQDDGAATFTHILNKGDSVLDFCAPARNLHNRIRALQPWPGSSFGVNGTPIRIGASDYDDSANVDDRRPGEVVESGSDTLSIATGGGVLRLLQLQRPGGRMLAAGNFLRGFQIQLGVLLEGGLMRRLSESRPTD